jgi:hypothetical protein
MPCECGCSTASPRADLGHGSECECGCTSPGTPEVHNVESLVSLVKDLDRRVRELESSASRN